MQVGEDVGSALEQDEDAGDAMRIAASKGIGEQTRVPTDEFIEFVCKFKRSAIVLRVAELSKAKLFHEFGKPDTLHTWSAMALLAKTALLFGDDEKPEPNDKGWQRLFEAANSIERCPDTKGEDPVASVVREHIKTAAEQRFLTRDDLKYLAGRSYIMLRDIADWPEHRHLEVDRRLRELTGVGAEGYLLLMYALFGMFSLPDKPLTSFRIDAVLAPLAPEVQQAVMPELVALLGHISCDIDGFRKAYHEATITKSDGTNVRKYKLEDAPRFLYATEPNPLRDYPILHVPGDSYICPITPWLFVRAFYGVYYDLIEAFRREEEREGGARRNVFEGKAGYVFQDYIGLQLKQVVPAENLREEFIYQCDGEGRSPDFIICKNPKSPLFVECKARRPSAVLIATGSEESVNAELTMGVARALAQVAEFISRANGGVKGLEEYSGLTEYRLLIVMMETFPTNCFEPRRQKAVQLAMEMKPLCADIIAKMDWFAASAHDLEYAVNVARHRDVPLDRQFKMYSEYLRMSQPIVTTKVKKGKKHLEIRQEWTEYLQRRYGGFAADNNLVTDAFKRLRESGNKYFLGGQQPAAP